MGENFEVELEAVIKRTTRSARIFGIACIIGGLIALYFVIAQPTGPINSQLRSALQYIGIVIPIFGLGFYAFAPLLSSLLFRHALDDRPGRLVNDIRKIGRTTYITTIYDDEDHRELTIRVTASIAGTSNSSPITWPYQDKQTLLRDIDDLLTRQPEPIQGQSIVNFVTGLLNRRTLGHFGVIAEIEEQHQKIDVFLVEHCREKLLLIKKIPSGVKGSQHTWQVCMPFDLLYELKMKIKEQIAAGNPSEYGIQA